MSARIDREERDESLALPGLCSDADHFATHLGIVGVHASAERGRAELALDARHLNAAGRVHGGGLFSLGDAAIALAANARPREVAVVTASHIQFLEAAMAGEHLVAFAEREFRRGRRSGYRVRITRGDDLVALGSGETLVIKQTP